MRVEFSVDELLIIEEYAEVMLKSPCLEHCDEEDRRACCGCQREVEFLEHNKAIINNYKDLIRNNSLVEPTITALCDAYRNTIESERVYNQAKKGYEKAQRNLSTLLDQVKSPDAAKFLG